MKPAIMVFRLGALVALLLGLVFLFRLSLFAPWMIPVHMLFGLITVLGALFLGWRLRSTPGWIGALLALMVLGLGLSFRSGAAGVTTLGLVHLAAAVVMIGLVEMAAGKARRAL